MCTTCLWLLPTQFYLRISLIYFLPIRNLNESVKIDLTLMSIALWWRAKRCTVCSNGKVFCLWPFTLFSVKKSAFSITAMNYLNYVFNKIFQILSNAFLQTELFFSTIFISPTSAILWRNKAIMLRFINKSFWINIWLCIVYPIAIKWYWHLFLFFPPEVDILLLNSSYMRGSNWHDHALPLFK